MARMLRISFCQQRSGNAVLRSVAAFSLLGLALPALAQDDASDETAKTEEESRFGNFVVLPVIITEPAIGEGLGAGLVYFHRKAPADKPKIITGGAMVNTAKRPKPPPTATGLFGAYTSNDTAAVGIGHSNSLRDDTIRVVGALASMRVNAAIFAFDIPVDFKLNGELVYASAKRRIGASNTFLGLSISALNAEVDFQIAPGNPAPAGLFDFSFRNVGIAGSATYDARDDSMMPGNGRLIDFTLWRYDDAIGSDFDYWSARFKINSFHQLSDKWVLGWRLDASTVDGAPPFFAVPYVSLRGIPALRFQGDSAGVAEVEVRYNLAQRWAGVAFAGTGFTSSGNDRLKTTESINAGGLGLRFQALREQNVWLGLDIAQGPEETTWYIQMGHPW